MDDLGLIIACVWIGMAWGIPLAFAIWQSIKLGRK